MHSVLLTTHKNTPIIDTQCGCPNNTNIMDTIHSVFHNIQAIFQLEPTNKTYTIQECWDRPTTSNNILLCDSDGFAIECLYRLREKGIIAQLAICYTGEPEKLDIYNNCVCCVDIDGEYYVLDYSINTVVELQNLRYCNWHISGKQVRDPWSNLVVKDK